MTSATAFGAAGLLADAEALRRNGRVGQAIALLRALIAKTPEWATPNYQLALALNASGDRAGAEISLRRALDLDPTLMPAATMLASALTQRGAPDEALRVLAACIASDEVDIHLLTAQGDALKSLGRQDAAISAYQRAALVSPTSGVGEHNLAAILGDAHRFSESEAATRRARAKGLDAPETWLIHGRALRGLRQFDEAEAAFREAIRRRASYAEAHADLAQLIWMRTENLNEARRTLDQALARFPFNGPLTLALAKLLEYSGFPDQAAVLLVAALDDGSADPVLMTSAAVLLTRFSPAAALRFAERAVALSPGSGPPRTALCQTYLALGRPDAAAAIAEDLQRGWPLDQIPVALAATAWRMLGDPRYRDYYDYSQWVRTWVIETPPDWPDLRSFLADLSSSLRELQQLNGHPIGQSLRHGTQTEQSLALSKNPTIAAFFSAIDAPIRAYIDHLRAADGPLGGRAMAGYRFSGAWSALLRPGGHHVNHLHPLGWISSACHIDLPPEIDDGHQGWLQFGEPGVITDPPLSAEHFVKPRAGQLVLFPSYMWHGTVPFGGNASRLTISFDLLPD